MKNIILNKNSIIGLFLFTIVLSIIPGLVMADTMVATEFRITASYLDETEPTLGVSLTTDLVVYTQIQPDGTGDIWYQPLFEGAPDGVSTRVTSMPGIHDQLNDVSGDYIVYTSTEGGYNFVVVYEISTGSSWTLTPPAIISDPHIDGDWVVWLQSAQVMLYNLMDLGTAAQAQPISGIPASSPQIGDRFAVWVEGSDIVVWDLSSSTTMVVGTAGIDTNPTTSGPWVAWLSGEGPTRVEAINMDVQGSGRTVADNGTLNLRPSMHGDLIAWESNVAGNFDIWVYRLSNGESFPVNADMVDQQLTNVHGNLVAYVDARASNKDVWVSTLEFIPSDPCEGLGGDTDGDGVCNANDNCPDVANADQADSDGDGVGDACDAPPDPCAGLGGDTDGDGVCDSADICPGFDDTVDGDGDGVPDGCDICPADNPDDSDGDGVCDSSDICPGFDDNADADDDTVPDGCDLCVGDDASGDTDADGVCNDTDICPLDISNDADGDGLCPSNGDCDDNDPNNFPGNTEVCDGQDNDCNGADDVLGFAGSETDNDGDGLSECQDDCNDADAAINPNADEICDDGKDNNCDGEENSTPLIDIISAPADPIAIGESVIVTVDFTDPNANDTHIVSCDWGDDSTSEAYLEQGSRSIEDTHTYTHPGVYTVTAIVSEDYCGGNSAQYQYIVVYDPNGGFVTGGGWINSPEGAYTADPSLTGKATFGFVSKYKKGATEPTGVTEFQFKVADLNFHSDTYDWLVIASAKAQYKGVGTINGEGEYKFMLSGIDADINDNDGFEVDRFRIRIWYEVDDIEHVVYDNALGDDSDNATTEVSGGSIVIHSGKGKK
jgi:hypothetical protein